MKIDIFTHVMLPRYKKELYRHSDRFATEKAVQDRRPLLTDSDGRLRMLAEFSDVTQVLSVAMPPVEEVLGPAEAAELARISNDEMAELIAQHPDRYVTAIANVPLNDMDATLKETERAVKELGFKGVQIYSRVNGRPPSTDFMTPLYELMVELDLPIWIHPMRSSDQPDYSEENVSYNQLFSIFGWPYDTTAAMIRLVFSGIFEKFPTIKFITHHCGGMAPYFSDRLKIHYDNGLERLGTPFFPGLTKHPVEYLKMFYADTALDGNSNKALECGLAFFGEDHILFGSDTPFDIENGGVSTREAIRAVERLDVSETTRHKIFEGNARRLLHL
jgi:uncharacterized protein